MPWTAKDSYRHTHKATTPTKKRQWAHVADNVLAKTGNEALAIREANGVVGKNKKRGK